MKKLIFIVALLVGVAQGQTTTITGTIKDLTGANVTSGKVTFTLAPSRDTTISGTARFTPQTVVCLINGSGAIVAQNGSSVCTVTTNTSLQPPGSYYVVAVWPGNVKTSQFTFYAVLNTYDISTVVPTPTTSPAQNFVDVFANQTIGGNKTFSGNTFFTGSVSLSSIAKINNVISVDGVTYSGSSALQNATLACVATNQPCIVDARDPIIGNQTITTGTLFPNNPQPITWLTGPYTISTDLTTVAGLNPGNNFRWVADNTIVSPSAANTNKASCTTNTVYGGLVIPQVQNFTATTVSGNASITVSSSIGMTQGTMVAIPGVPANGTGIEGTQSTTINQGGGIGTGDGTVTVTGASNANFSIGPTTAYNYIKIDSEIIGYTGITATTFTGLVRGALGTTAATHSNGATVFGVAFFTTEIASITDSTHIVVTDAPTVTVTAAPALFGSSNISFEGQLTIDGQLTTAAGHVSGGGCSDLIGLGLFLSSQVTVAPSLQFQNLGTAGVAMAMAQHNNINGFFHFIGTGNPFNAGADVFILGQCKANTIRTSEHDGGNFEILIDDRSTLFFPYDGASNYNVADIAADTGGRYRTAGVGIEGGSSGNIIRLGYLSAQSFGAYMITSGQWTTDPAQTNNTVYFGAIDSTSVALEIVNQNSGTVAGGTMIGGQVNTGSIVNTSDGKNAICSNTLGLTGYGCAAPFGMGGNSYEWIMHRSGGNSGFPDIIGSGTKLIVGDANGFGLGSAVTDFSPGAANTTDLGTTALPYKDLWVGTAATNNFKFQPAATAQATTITMADPVLASVGLPFKITSGTATFTTTAVTAGTCQTTVTVAATGAATTDAIEVAYASAPTGTTDGLLVLNKWVTSGNVNFARCNPTAGSITPTALVLNWRVIR